MLNWIFLGLIVASVITAAFTGTMPKVTEASLSSAKTAVELSIGLVGQMALWLGFMGVLREAGLMRGIARALKPVMTRLFPQVPPEHPAMGAMIMNIAANILGLGNAATPFGLKAMSELDKLNTHRGISTNAMSLFMVINNSGVAVLPLGVVAMRATVGSKDPAGVIVPSLIATMINTVVSLIVCKVLERRRMFAAERYLDGATPPPPVESKVDEAAIKKAEADAAERPRTPVQRLALIVLIVGALGWALAMHVSRASDTLTTFDVTRGVLSDWLLPLLMLTIVLVGFGKQVKVYEAFISAAKEGFQVAIVIIPFLVAILVAIGMFRASGAMDAIASAVGPVTELVGFPAQALPMTLIRPLSGSGALAVMTDTMKSYGADSFVGYLVSLINGSSETTFYVLALYFGSVQVRALRHTLAACLISDVLHVAMALLVAHLFFGDAPTVILPAVAP